MCSVCVKTVSKDNDLTSSHGCVLQDDSVINEADVFWGILATRSFTSQEMQDSCGKNCMFTVFNEFTQMAKSCGKKKHRLRKKWNFHTLAAIWNFSTFYQESFSSNYVVKERKHTAADIQKDRSYLEKSALQAMTFLVAKTISNKVWGLCLPRKLARVSFSRKKKTKSRVDRIIDERHFTTSLKKSFAAICFAFSPVD